MISLPKRGEIWLHHSGRRYQVVDVANLISTTPGATAEKIRKFPVTIVYRVEHAPIVDPFTLFARDWEQFQGSFSRVEES